MGGRGAFYYVAGEINRLLVPVDRQFGSSISGGTTFTTPASAIQQFVDTIRSSHGYDAGSMDHVLLERNSASIFSRLDFTLPRKHRLSVRYSFFRSQTDRPPDIAGVYAGNTVSENVTTAHTATAELSSIFEDDFLNELFLGYTARTLHSLPVGEPFPFLDVSVTDPRRHWNHLMAGSDGGAVDGRLVDHMLELRNTTTLFRGSHCITFGMHHELHWFDSFFLDDQYGRYTFDAIADVARLRPREYEFRYVRSDAAREGIKWRALQLGAYLQDEWWVSPRVRLSAGVRVDVPLFLDTPGENPDVGETFRPLGFDVRTSRLPMTRPLFSPRIAWNIDPAGDRSSQIRGGIGVLTGRVPFIWLSNQFAHTGLNYVHVREVVAPPPFVADPARQPRPGDWPSLRERSEINITDPDFVFPQVLRGTLGIDFSLPWNLVASAEVVFSRSLNDVTFRNINLKDGRPPEPRAERGPAAGVRDVSTVATLGSRPRRVDLLAYHRCIHQCHPPLEHRRGVFASAQYRSSGSTFDDGFFMSLAYTYGNAKDMNSGTSDQAYAQWRFNPAYDPNEPSVAYSSFDRRHTVVAAASFRWEWACGWATTIGVVYTGMSGQPFSYVYDGDLNGDGEAFNDLFYVPARRSELLLVNSHGDQLKPDRDHV